MRLQSFEQKGTKNKDPGRKGPKIQINHAAFPEPDIIDEGVPISLGYIEGRVQLDIRPILLRQHLERPEYGGQPETELEQDVHELPYVLEKNHQRRRYPGYAETEHDGRKEIIDGLKYLKVRKIAVACEHKEHHHDEEQMDDEGGQDFYDRKDANPEDHLLNKIALLDDGHGCRGYAFAQEKPGNHAGHDPENEGKVGDRR